MESGEVKKLTKSQEEVWDRLKNGILVPDKMHIMGNGDMYLETADSIRIYKFDGDSWREVDG